MVRLLPVALTHGNISIKITQQGGGLVGAGAAAGQESISVVESENQLVYLNPNETLSSLVNALNEIGATPKDLISIIEALKESGALIGIVQII